MEFNYESKIFSNYISESCCQIRRQTAGHLEAFQETQSDNEKWKGAQRCRVMALFIVLP